MMRSSSPVSRVWTNCILTSAQHCTSAIITEQPSSISNISLSRCTLYRQKVAFYASKPTIFLHIHRPLYTVCMSHMINSERDVCETVVERLSAVETELWDRRRGFHFTKWFNTFWMKRNTNKNNLILPAQPVRKNIYTGCYGKWCQISFWDWKSTGILERMLYGMELKRFRFRVGPLRRHHAQKLLINLRPHVWVWSRFAGETLGGWRVIAEANSLVKSLLPLLDGRWRKDPSVIAKKRKETRLWMLCEQAACLPLRLQLPAEARLWTVGPSVGPSTRCAVCFPGEEKKSK